MTTRSKPQPAPAKAEKTPTPQKQDTAKPEVVQVTAADHVHMGDEKVVPFRQAPKTDHSILVEDMSDSSTPEEQAAEEVPATEPPNAQQEKVKKIFNTMMDAQHKVDPNFVCFTYNAPHDIYMDFKVYK